MYIKLVTGELTLETQSDNTGWVFINVPDWVLAIEVRLSKNSHYWRIGFTGYRNLGKTDGIVSEFKSETISIPNELQRAAAVSSALWKMRYGRSIAHYQLWNNELTLVTNLG